MTPTAVSHCAQCGAMVNIHWPSCLVCRAGLPLIGPQDPSTAVESSEPRPPAPPILPGWLVAYRGRAGNLCGGADDRIHGTVQECRWDGAGWTVVLTDAQHFPPSIIRAVGQTDALGRLIAAWEVKRHGYDGRKQEATP
jgi:hypothetical protein